MVSIFSTRDAWAALGDMPKEIAMQKYVEEIKKVLAENYALLCKMGSSLRSFWSSI